MNSKEIVRAWQEANPRADHNLQQGSADWHQFRAGKFGASEATAMMGVSPNTTRGELMRMRFSGGAKDFSDWVQKNILDKGHVVEGLARPIAEAMIGQELYPVVVSRGNLSASCDGLTMDDEIAFEHKQYNADLYRAIQAGVLPDQHVPQCQQIMLVTGALRLLFVCSDGTEANFTSVWVEPDYDYMAKLIAGWKQFESDLAAFKPVESAPAVVGATVESFPVLNVQLSGAIIASNLVEYEAEIIARIKAIKDDLQSDQDFADAEKMVKALKEAKEAMGLSIKQARASVEDIDALFNTAERIAAELDAKRIWLDKLVKARKENLRAEIVSAGRDAYLAHIEALNTRVGRRCLSMSQAPNFAAAISGKKNFNSMRDAVAAALANAKIEANSVADAVEMNLKHFTQQAGGYKALFHDLDSLLFKPADDFALVVKSRIADHQAEQERNLEAGRARIRAEEEARAKAAVQPLVPTPAKRETPVGAAPLRPHRPTDGEIISCLCVRFGATHAEVFQWLKSMQLDDISRAA